MKVLLMCLLIINHWSGVRVQNFLSISENSSAPNVQADERPRGSKGNVKKPVDNAPCESYYDCHCFVNSI